MSTFDHIEFDEESEAIRVALRDMFKDLELASAIVQDPRCRALALTKLEEAAFWFNKGLKTDQGSREIDLSHDDGYDG